MVFLIWAWRTKLHHWTAANAMGLLIQIRVRRVEPLCIAEASGTMQEQSPCMINMHQQQRLKADPYVLCMCQSFSVPTGLKQ